MLVVGWERGCGEGCGAGVTAPQALPEDMADFDANQAGLCDSPGEMT